jgi:hypothetical protein
MARRPVLEKYPRLHSILRNDPAANAQFNACLAELQNALTAGADPRSLTATNLAKS